MNSIRTQPSKFTESEQSITKRKIIAESVDYEYLGRVVSDELIPDNRKCDYGLYKKRTCGHIHTILHKNVENIKTDYCKQCVSEDYVNIVESLGMKFIGFSRKRNNGTSYVDVVLPCNHNKSIQTGNLKVGAYSCKVCLEENYKEICTSFGMKYISHTHSTYHKVELPCGCCTDKHISNIRMGHWSCSNHKMSSLDSVGYIYMYKITYDGKSWIKIGYSSNYTQRSLYYSDLPLNIELLSVIQFESGRLAVKVEKKLHKDLKEHKLKDFDVRQYMHSGFSECYPISIEGYLLNELERIKNE